eukprot:CCRYP_015829-RB/>CCRYP_015829-RB protein AED:0.38 eAED:0.41 QI:915/0.33/0.5/1/0/0/4/0/147
MLVPRYRPIKRFSTLVEKDFMSFGHPFHIRCDHGQGKKIVHANDLLGQTLDDVFIRKDKALAVLQEDEKPKVEMAKNQVVSEPHSNTSDHLDLFLINCDLARFFIVFVANGATNWMRIHPIYVSWLGILTCDGHNNVSCTKKAPAVK